MRACSRVALVLMVLSASFGLAGCAAIDDLKFAIAQWFESARFPDGRGVLPDNDLPNATPMIPPEKIPKQDATKPSEKMPKAARKLRRPQTVKLQEKPPISNSTEAVRPEETEGQSAPPVTLRLRTPSPKRRRPEFFHAEIGHRWTQSNAAALRVSLDEYLVWAERLPGMPAGP